MLRPCPQPTLHHALRAGLPRPALVALTVLILALLPSVLAPSPLAAQMLAPTEVAPNRIIEIRLEGAQATSVGEVLTKLSSAVGDPVHAAKVTEDVKTIFALGFYQDVQAEVEEVPREGVRLIFRLVEKPRIAALRAQGNAQVSEKKLYELLAVPVGAFYSRAALEAGMEAIRQEYRGKGFYQVKITHQVERVSDMEFNVTVLVEESPRLYLTDIRVHGSKVFSELDIQRMMNSAEVDCFSWMTDSGLFDEERINQDLQVIVARYVDQGYIRVFIDKPQVRLIHNRDYSKVLVDLTIDEGEQYFTGIIDVGGDILGDKALLLDGIGLKTGGVYSPLKLNRDRFGLSELYQEQGYAFVRVSPQLKVDDAARTVDVTFHMNKGDKAYIGRIEFQGNRETRDYVMRREIEVRENELYNGRLLRQSQANLTALGYFKPSLKMDTEPTEVSNVLDVVAQVEESQTGTLQAQFGYSNQTGTTLSASVSKGNFLGRGQTLRTTVQWGQKSVTQDFSMDFIEPRLFETRISSDTSVAFRKVEDTSELDRGLITETKGSQGFGYPLVRTLRLNIALAGENRVFEDEDAKAVRLRTFTTALNYNTVNHPVFPSAGVNALLAVSQIGGQVLGGSTEYRRYRLQWQRFDSLNDDATLIMMIRARAGWLQQVGSNVIPPEDRFRMGGITSVRGFRTGVIGGPFGRLERELNSVRVLALDDQGGPLLDSSGNPVYRSLDSRTLGLDEDTLAQLQGGGTFERLLNVEVLFPLAGNNVRGVVFYDAGEVNAERVQYVILNADEPGFFDLHQSVGAGVRLITPLGVFRFEYGSKLNPRPGESPDEFDFTISTLF